MLRWRRFRQDDGGSAALEFLAAGTVLLVPLVALIVAVSALQSASFAAHAVAAQAARMFATSTGADSGADSGAIADRRGAIDLAVLLVLEDFGISPASVALAISCQPSIPCPTRGGTVTAVATIRVPILSLPLVGSSQAMEVPVSAEVEVPVSRFNSGY